MIVVFSKLNQKDAQKAYEGIKNWFSVPPGRRKQVCNTEMGPIRKTHIKEDLLNKCEDGVVLKDK